MCTIRIVLLFLGLGLGGNCLMWGQDLAQATAHLPTPGVHQYVYVDRKPVAVNLLEVRQKIGYPVSAWRNGVEGIVYCRILVDPEGKPLDYVITRNLHPEIDRRVASYIGELEFEPAIRNDSAVKYWANLGFPFKKGESQQVLNNRVDEINFLRHASGNSQRAAGRSLANGLAYLADGELASAKCELQDAIRHSPRRKNPRGSQLEDLFMAHFYLARTEADLFNWDNAEMHWTESIGLADGSRRLRGNEEVHQRLPWAYLGRADMRLKTGDIVAASDDCQWVLQNYDDPMVLAEAYLQQSRIRVFLGNYAEALNQLQLAMELDPQSGACHIQKAEILLEMGAEESACEVLGEMATRDLNQETYSQYHQLRQQICWSHNTLGQNDLPNN